MTSHDVASGIFPGNCLPRHPTHRSFCRLASHDLASTVILRPYILESLGDFFARWLEINQHDVHDVNKSNVMEFMKKCQVSLASMKRSVEAGTVTAEMAEPIAR
jgi:hypothetical protein